MKAEELRKIAKDVNIIEISKTYTEIMQKAKEAAEKGEYTFIYKGKLPMDIKAKFYEDGFRITSITDGYEFDFSEPQEFYYGDLHAGITH